MDFELNGDQKEFQNVMRDFVNKEINPVAMELEKSGEYPTKIVQGLKDLGLFGMTVPEEYGGLDLDPVSFAIVFEELARGWVRLLGHRVQPVNGYLQVSYRIDPEAADDFVGIAAFDVVWVVRIVGFQAIGWEDQRLARRLNKNLSFHCLVDGRPPIGREHDGGRALQIGGRLVIEIVELIVRKRERRLAVYGVGLHYKVLRIDLAQQVRIAKAGHDLRAVEEVAENLQSAIVDGDVARVEVAATGGELAGTELVDR